ncbi:hypothetical protein ANANG_G00166350 [Anguilla anguilla]|uniref:RNA methyltransferase n=1 Tax=Anguilla anguilla TaxID=7936 RepID=A0A9D3RZD4_ANGAN|nr:hypothetical protein ANANG_G00166350 [Anguilla anguilla]
MLMFVFSSQIHASSHTGCGPVGRKMIEMSVDKETVLPRGGHPEPRGPAECAGKCRGSEAGGGGGQPRAPSGPSCAGGPRWREAWVWQSARPKPSREPARGRGRDRGDPAQPRDTTHGGGAGGPAAAEQAAAHGGCGFKPPGPGSGRRRAHSESDPVLPSNFLLGGNIFDPLNLNSLLDEEVNRAINAETPESSPLPAKSRDPWRSWCRETSPTRSTSTATARCCCRHTAAAGGGGTGTAITPGRGRGRGQWEEGPPPLHSSTRPRWRVGGASRPSRHCRCPRRCRAWSPTPPGRGLRHPSRGPCLKTSWAPLPRLRPRPSLPAAPPLSLRLSLPQAPPLPRPLSPSNANAGVTPPVLCPAPCIKRAGPWGRGRGQGLGAATPPGPAASRPPAEEVPVRQLQQVLRLPEPGCSEDPRIRVMEPEWFRGKRVLDLGCNTGHLTLFIARNWRPARIVGLDIDGGLVHAARQNVRHYLSDLQAQEARRGPGGPGAGPGRGEEPATREEEGLRKDGDAEGRLEAESCEEGGAKERGRSQEEGVAMELQGGGSPLRSVECGGTNGGGAESEADPTAPPAGPAEHDAQFPVSLRISRGPIAAPPPRHVPHPTRDFPANVSFVRGNYVLESDALLHAQRAEYDVILCLSISKWVHLNWGDSGLQRLFRRVYSHLHPGGVFILEPQPWGSYGRRRKLTDTIYKNYHSIRLKPDQFCSYLTSEVGFTGYELLGTPKSTSRGFERPIYKFYKGPSCPRK